LPRQLRSFFLYIKHAENPAYIILIAKASYGQVVFNFTSLIAKINNTLLQAVYDFLYF